MNLIELYPIVILTRKDKTILVLFPRWLGMPLQSIINMVRAYKSTKVLMVLDAIPNLFGLILFRLALYMRVGVLRRLYRGWLGFLRLSERLCVEFNLVLFMLFICFMVI